MSIRCHGIYRQDLQLATKCADSYRGLGASMYLVSEVHHSQMLSVMSVADHVFDSHFVQCIRLEILRSERMEFLLKAIAELPICSVSRMSSISFLIARWRMSVKCARTIQFPGQDLAFNTDSGNGDIKVTYRCAKGAKRTADVQVNLPSVRLQADCEEGIEARFLLYIMASSPFFLNYSFELLMRDCDTCTHLSESLV